MSGENRIQYFRGDYRSVMWLCLVVVLALPCVGQVEVSTYANLNAADGLARDEAGNIYAARYSFTGLSDVFKVDRNGNVSVFIENQAGPAGMVFDESGSMYLARYNSGEIAKFDPNGAFQSVFANGIGGPIGLDFDSNGNLYVNHNVELFFDRIDPGGNRSRYATHGVFNTSSLTIDDSNNVYISAYPNGRILKVRSSDRQVSTFTDLPASGIGFIMYSNGYFYATAIQNHLILRITMDGIADTLAGTGVNGYLDGPGNTARFSTPNGITATPDGDTIFVAESNRIRMITGVRTNISPSSDLQPVQTFTLSQNYPNPFNPNTVIEYSLSKRTNVELVVYNANGQKVRVLIDQEQAVGNCRAEWDGRDEPGQLVSSGVYYYQLRSGQYQQTRKMILIQ